MANLQKRIKSRDLHATNLTKLFSKVEDIYKDFNDEKLSELIATLEIAETKFTKISEINAEVESQLEGEDQEEMSEKGMILEIELKTKISRLKSFIRDRTPSQQPPKVEHRVSTSTATAKSNVKLPRLEIVKFNGDYTKWQTFYDSFEAAVEKNYSLSNIEKFNYLRSYLTNDAYNCIAGLSLTNENYDQAMKLLKERYGNKQKIITAHVNELLEMQICGNDTKAIRLFYDNIESHVRSLQGIGVDGKEYGTVLAPVIMNKMPGEFRLAISRGLSETDEWELTKLLDLMQRELRARETCANDTPEDGKRDFFTGSGLHVGQKKPSQSQRKQGLSCVFCRGNHWSDKCGAITDPIARKEHLRKNRLCFLCLKGGHSSRDCSKTKTCFYCKGFHNSSICVQRGQKEDSPTSQPASGSTTKTTSGHVQQNSCVLLQTADVILKNANDTSKEVKVKVMFDSGSQRTYVSDRVKNILNLPTKGTERLELSTFGNNKTSNQIASNVEFSIATPTESIPIRALAVPFICLPVRNQPIEAAKAHFDSMNLNFADSGLDNEIDLLLGSDYFWELVTGRILPGKETGLVAMETKLGWVLSGPITLDSTTSKKFSTSFLTHAMSIADQPTDADNLQTLVEKFWDLETLGISETEKSPWEESFEEKITRNADNRYEIELPFKYNHPLLPDNYELSKKRLMNLQDKLLQDPEKLEAYANVLEGHRNMGVIETAPDESTIGETHYLPHRGVINEESSTTKLRVVFDASAKANKKVPSLNDCLMKGSNYTPLLYDILLRFRTKAIALTADIAKAFYMISIAETDRDYLRFLWFDNIFSDQPKIVRNRFARLVMGVTSSPAALNATIRKHVENYEFDEEFIRTVHDSFYVDDFVGGAQSIEQAIELLKKLKLRFMEAYFYLRKWKTNNSELRNFINELSTNEAKEQNSHETKEQNSGETKELSSDETKDATQGITSKEKNFSKTMEKDDRKTKGEFFQNTEKNFLLKNKESDGEIFDKTLGIVWDSEKDVFVFDFSQLVQEGKKLKPTKRNVLKILSSFYDPLGLIQPIIISLKILMQRICKDKLSWDETLPDELSKEWFFVLNSLESIGTLSVNRRLESLKGNVVTRELHGFCDASKQGYGASVYNKSIYETGEIETNLLTSKTRVAPIKGPTLPRLELLSTLLLTRLMNSVEGALSTSFPFDRKRYWNDSKIALAWIDSTHKEFKPFVENRLKNIRENSNPEEWGYVESEQNPTDVITRFNEQAMSFNKNELWWKGPEFLRRDQPYEVSYEPPTEIPEEKVNWVNLAHAKSERQVNLDKVMKIERYSDYSRLLRVTAWVKRFTTNLVKSRKKEPIELSPILSAAELREAEKQWLQTNQIEFFNDATGDLQRKFSEHGVALDDGLLRCTGRLNEAPLPYETRKPILLNPRHRLASLIVVALHRKLKHVSAKQTLTELRQRFWIFKGRAFVRTILRKCTRCRLFNSKPYRYPAAPPLTKLRLQDNHPFSTTGVDNFGPLYVKEVFPTRNRYFKAWVALYTCASSRAVLLDLVPDIGSTSFIRSFRRFKARRGCPNNVISDNGSNFVSTETQTFVTNLGVDWDLNIPLAPWHGGFFERLVKSAKELLRKELTNTTLTFEEMQTVLAEVEQILNNRPLTYAYPDDLECCLTPNHLLFGRCLPYHSNEKQPIDLQFDEKSADRVTNLIQHFWERWRKEYVVNLRETQKLTIQNKLQPSPAVGDIVIVHEDKLPRSMWRLGKIEQLQGERGAVVLTQKSRLTRPVNLLYPIEYIRNDHELNMIPEPKGVSDDTIDTINTHQRPRRDAAIRGELKRKFLS